MKLMPRMWLVAVLGTILMIGTIGLVKMLWPDKATVSSDVLSYPLALAVATMTWLIVAKMGWAKQTDGTFVFSAKTRWAYVGICLLGTLGTIAITILMLYKELWMPR